MTTNPNTIPANVKRARRLTPEQIERRSQERADAAFIAAVKVQEKRTGSTWAYVVIDPNHPRERNRVVLTMGAGGTVLAIAWLPGTHTDERGNTYRSSYRHTAKAHGFGYDKWTAAMGGARYLGADGIERTIKDSGMRWDQQLEDAGLIVVQAV